jgi:hypothetical protein
MSWLGGDVDAYAKLHESLSKHAAFIGLVAEAQRKTIVAVFEPDLGDWTQFQQLQPKLKRARLELRPGCHTRAQRELAERELKGLAADPTLSRSLHAFSLDPSNAGFRVHVLPGATEVAKVVQERLRSMANVWFTRPVGEHSAR